MAISTVAIAGIVQSMAATGKTDRIEDTLLALGVTPCVARDWSHEPRRAKFLKAKAWSHRSHRHERRANRPEPGMPYRNIIHTIIGKIREHHLHATKGWRSYCRSAA